MSGLKRVDSRVGMVDNGCSLFYNSLQQMNSSLFDLATFTLYCNARSK